MDFLSNLISGLSLGSIYALIALGYTMVYGIAKMLNFAHGDIIMVGAFTVIVCVNMCGLPHLGGGDFERPRLRPVGRGHRTRRV